MKRRGVVLRSVDILRTVRPQALRSYAKEHAQNKGMLRFQMVVTWVLLYDLLVSIASGINVRKAQDPNQSEQNTHDSPLPFLSIFLIFASVTVGVCS